MNENERAIGPDFNPYDQLLEPESEPVRSPVILGKANKPEKTKMAEKQMEIIPLASEATYSRIPVRVCRTADVIQLEVEEDLLVPDTFPDMESILNMDAAAESAEIYIENGNSEIKGKIKLETIYRSNESYGSNVCVLPAELNFARAIQLEGSLHVSVQIKKTEYRIINERKYKARVYAVINIKCEAEKDYLVFEGIDGETLYLHKDELRMLDLISRKTSESDVSEEMFINDDKIRPVKILKSKVTVAENHRQLTKDKLVLNQTLWVRVMYLAEIASKGNLSNQAMFFQGKIDHTQFINLSRSDGEVAACTTTSTAENVKIEINREASGFEVSGEIVTEINCFGLVEREQVTDFYHNKEDMTCDRKGEPVCVDVNCVSAEQTLRESISLQQESGDELRIIYMDAQPVDISVDIEGGSAVVRGKLHLEAVIMNEGDYMMVAKKICDFCCMKELPQDAGSLVEADRVFVREMKGDISGRELNLTAQVQANLNIYNEAEFVHISNPCIIRSGKPERCYPITIHTVADGESVWDIGKKYKVSEEQIRHYNKEENIRPGKKIIVVK